MGKIGEDKNVGKDTRFPHNDPTKGGRKPSIKKQLKELLLQDGQVKIESKQVVGIEEDGSVIIKLPTEMQLAMKLKQLAMSGKNATTLNAIKTIMEQLDGKPNQYTEQTNTHQIEPILFRRIGKDGEPT